MKRSKLLARSAALVLSMLMLAGCGPRQPASGSASTGGESGQSGSAQEPPDASSAQEPEKTGIDALLENMTLREKVGQLFIIRPDSLDAAQSSAQVSDSSAQGVTALDDGMEQMLRDYPVGGVVLFQKNIQSESQLTGFIASMQQASKLPMLVAVDEEGGLVARIGNHAAFDVPRYKSAAAVGSSGNAQDARDMGTTIGTYLSGYGFNMDFAPVADVNTNPDNPVIGTRAFSSDPVIAAEMANAMADGLKQEGIIPVFKHFPGHGDTAEDSHSGIAISNKTQAEMEACEWLPYAQLGAEACVMVGHIAVPELTGELTPATMSRAVVSGILRQQLGFDGVVITDSLEMGAIRNDYTCAQAVLGAIEAGCDMLLGPEDFQQAFDAVLTAVDDGTISQQRLDESVRRILTLKQAYGLLE